LDTEHHALLDDFVTDQFLIAKGVLQTLDDAIVARVEHLGSLIQRTYLLIIQVVVEFILQILLRILEEADVVLQVR
jgi:hypothetical protein